jgi:Immunity protein 50
MDSTITGAEQVTKIFGYWPSFYDAEVIRLELVRSDPSVSGPIVLADIHAFERTDEIDSEGLFVLRKQTLVSLRFEGIDRLKLEGFNHQNALWGLHVIDIRRKRMENLAYEVHFDGSFGVHCEFMCHDVRVERVRPWPARAR